MKKLQYIEFKEELSKVDIDFFLTSSSFEERCLIISTLLCDLNISTKIFFSSNESDIIVKNSIKLEALLKNTVERIELDTDNPISNFQKILTTIDTIVKQKNKPNILIDITTFTHEALLLLTRVLYFQKNNLGKVFVAYVGAKEYSFNESVDNDKWLTKGIKEIRTIIGYPGFSDPTKQNHLLVLFGFESDRTKKIIDEFEFDHISLGFASVEGSIQENHQRINSQRHRTLASECNADLFEFSLIDQVERINKYYLVSISKKELF